MALLLHGDCLELMKTLDDKSIDCFICDLPYGCLSGGGGEEKKKRKANAIRKRFVNGVDTNTVIDVGQLNCTWDIKIDLKVFWEQVERLAKSDNTPIIHFCNTRFGIDLINSKPSWFRYDLVWNKGRGVSFLMANKMPMKSHEMIYIFSKKGAYYNRVDEKTDKPNWKVDDSTRKGLKSRQYGITDGGLGMTEGKDGLRCSLSVLNYKSGNSSDKHPTEKSKELYEWLLKRYCPPGGVVLDPTAGSFNSIKASLDLGLNAIGIEMNDKFYDKAVKYFEENDEIV